MANGEFPLRLVERGDGSGAGDLIDHPGLDDNLDETAAADRPAHTAAADRQVQTAAQPEPSGPPAAQGPGAAATAAPLPDELGAEEAQRAAFLTLVNWHRPQIELLCAQVTDHPHDAKEAVLAALAAVWHRLDDGLASTSPELWLYRTVRNVAITIAHRGPVGTSAPAQVSGGDGGAVRAVMLRLPPEHRSAFVLADGVGFDAPQVAHIESVAVDTATERVTAVRRAVAWGLAGAQDPSALGQDGMFDLGWLAAGNAAGTPLPNIGRTRTALHALCSPGLWDRTWEFYLEQAMASVAEPAEAAAAPAAPVGPLASPAPPPRRRRAVVWAAAVAALALLGVGVAVASRGPGGGSLTETATPGGEQLATATTARGNLTANDRDGSSGAKATTTKKPVKPTATTTNGAENGTSAGADNTDTSTEGADGQSGDDGAATSAQDDTGAQGPGADDADFGLNDGTTNDEFTIIDDINDAPAPAPPTRAGSARATAPSSGVTATTTAATPSSGPGGTAPPAPNAPALKVVASATAATIVVKWSGAASSATGTVVSWACCSPTEGGTTSVLSPAGSYTITGVQPSTQYRVTFTVVGAASGPESLTIAIRTTATPPTSAPAPTTTSTSTVAPTTAPPTTATTMFDPTNGAPGPPGPSAGGD